MRLPAALLFLLASHPGHPANAGVPNTVAIAVDTIGLGQKITAPVRGGIAAQVLDGLRAANIDFIPTEETKIVARIVDCAGLECLRNIAKSENLDWVVQVRVRAREATKKGKSDYVVSITVVRDAPDRGAWHEEADCPGCEGGEIEHMASLMAGEIAGHIKVDAPPASTAPAPAKAPSVVATQPAPLQAPPPPATFVKPPLPAPEPAWYVPRYWSVGTLAGGAVLAGAGVYLLHIDGRGTCDLAAPNQQCAERYKTQGLGIGMVAGGGLALLGGLAGLTLFAPPAGSTGIGFDGSSISISGEF